MNSQDGAYRPASKLPIHPAVWHFASAAFIGALATDVAYWRTAEMMWSNFSAWLLIAGLVAGLLAMLACLFDFITGRLVGLHRATWPYFIGCATALILSIFNFLVHMRDAWTSVVPTGLALSAGVVFAIVVSGWMGRSQAFRSHIGVNN